MHYHYLTLEQRNALSELMHSRVAEPGMAAALQRLHAPEFGVCESCAADIPFVALMANPRLLRCRRCLDQL